MRGLLVLVLGVVCGHPFGIGVYNDTPGSPPIDVQLPNALQLVGRGGWVTLYVEIPFDFGSPLCCDPPHWLLAALAQSWDLGLRVLLRLGSVNHSLRNLADDRNIPGTTQPRVKYGALAAAFARFASALPRAPENSLILQILNEPNVMSVEWQCTGSGNLTAAVAAVEAAHCVAQLRKAVESAVGAVPVTVAPIAYVGFHWILCDGSQQSAQTASAASFIGAMVAAVPTLYHNVSVFNAHPYPFQNAPFTQPLGKAGCAAYDDQMRIAKVNRSTAIFVSECGWAAPISQADKADYMVAAFKEVWLPDARIVGVTPFLLAGAAWPRFRWTEWPVNSSAPTVVYPQWKSVQTLRQSLVT